MEAIIKANTNIDVVAISKLKHLLSQMEYVKKCSYDQAERYDEQTESILDCAATVKTHIDAALYSM